MDDFNTSVLNDHDLLHGGVEDMVVENRANARRWARLVALHRRQADTDGRFAMTAREWTALKASEAWAMSDARARHQLNVALFLSEHLPEVWDLCRSGALDAFRATTIADMLRQRLDDPAHWARAGARVVRFLRRHLRARDGLEIVTCTVTQLRNKLNYEVRSLVTADQEFERRFADRTARVVDLDDGIGTLEVSSSIDQVKLAHHRLRTSAKALRAAGDPRTVSQLMSDLALDLMIGRDADAPVPRYARPIINVTVPLATLAGLRDDPATLSGGTVIPAELARAIAHRDGATWFRLLTDADDEPVALSTRSYRPTEEIWRYVVATGPTCAHEACDRPSVECELDHDEPWPDGATDAENLKPRCRRHHKAKHARAERPDLAWEYDLAA